MQNPLIESVRLEILFAFASAPMPDPAGLAAIPEFDDEGDRHVEYELAGKAWSELDAKWLDEWRYHLGYLRPESWRYYLPALLLATADETKEGIPFTLSTLNLLTPGYWRLYHLGRDPKFEYRNSLLAVQEQAAICSFLGYYMTVDRWDYPAAQALKWGWSQVAHPACDETRAFFDRLRHYTYPPIEDVDKRAVVDAIRAAFDARPYPGDNLCGSDQGDEPSEYALELRGLDWRTVHPDVVAHNYAALSFLTDEGFRYFMPAFMIADVLEVAGNGNPTFQLTHGFYEEKPRTRTSAESKSQVDWRAYGEHRCAGFTRPEREAIICYLEHKAKTDWDFVRQPIEQALDSYWRPSLAET